MCVCVRLGEHGCSCSACEDVVEAGVNIDTRGTSYIYTAVHRAAPDAGVPARQYCQPFYPMMGATPAHGDARRGGGRRQLASTTTRPHTFPTHTHAHAHTRAHTHNHTHTQPHAHTPLLHTAPWFTCLLGRQDRRWALCGSCEPLSSLSSVRPRATSASHHPGRAGTIRLAVPSLTCNRQHLLG